MRVRRERPAWVEFGRCVRPKFFPPSLAARYTWVISSPWLSVSCAGTSLRRRRRWLIREAALVGVAAAAAAASELEEAEEEEENGLASPEENKNILCSMTCGRNL